MIGLSDVCFSPILVNVSSYSILAVHNLRPSDS